MNANSTGIDSTKKKIMSSCEWKTAKEMENLAGPITCSYSDLLIAWQREGRVIAALHEGKYLYPQFQFDATLQPLPIVAQVIQTLGTDSDGWKVWAWFSFPNSWIDGCRKPFDRLDHSDELLFAASHHGNTYFA